ncbi:MAG TPA: TlpA disulfide reductase family protein [Methylomirabilota bacterium]|nr:TlpA disulfide reductase family protein [Methylomirabilota bacterium]
MQESPAFEKAYRKYKTRGVEFVGVQVQDEEADARRFLKAHQATYPAGLDPDLAIAKRFGYTATPLTVIIDRQGNIAARQFGPADDTWIAAHLAPLLKPK